MSKNTSRTAKSFKNISYSVISVLINLVLVFVVRTIFLNTLGSQYLGLNGLFSNILSMFALVELGIGSAIVFKLYKPLIDKNVSRIKGLMLFYKNAYRTISFIIIFFSVICIPFLDFFIKDDTSFINIQLVFGIYVLQTVSSYMFFAYKSSLLKADQKEYIIVRYGALIEIISALLQMAVLLLFASYYAYLIILVLGNIVKNILVSQKVDRDYNYLKDDTEYEKLSKEEYKEMMKDFGALFIYRINTVVINASNNIIISAFLSLITVGLYSNYLLITGAIKKITTPAFQSLKSSLGNLYAEKGSEATYRVFNIINLITYIVYGGASIGIFILSNTFITLWIGSEYVISVWFSALIAVEFYISGVRMFLSQFRNSLGLFQKAVYRPVLEIILNLVLTLIFVQYLGIYGVILGTIIASVLTLFIFDPIVVHKYGFYKNTSTYFIKNIYFIIVVLLTGVLVYYLTSFASPTSWLNLIVSFIISLVTILVIFLLSIIYLPEFKELLVYLKRMIGNRNKK